MKRITLVCGGGYSSSMLVTEIKKVIEKESLDIEIRSTSESQFYLYAENTDILLLAPQVRYLEKIMKEKYGKIGIKVMLIDSVDYGLMNGRKVIKKVLDNLEL